MYWLVVALPGLTACVSGWLLLRRPEALIRLSKIADRVVVTDHVAFLHRKPLGRALILTGMALLLAATRVVAH